MGVAAAAASSSNGSTKSSHRSSIIVVIVVVIAVASGGQVCEGVGVVAVGGEQGMQKKAKMEFERGIRPGEKVIHSPCKKNGTMSLSGGGGGGARLPVKQSRQLRQESWKKGRGIRARRKNHSSLLEKERSCLIDS